MKKVLCSLGLFLVLVLTFALAPVKATTEECAHENLKFQYYLEGQTQPTTCLEEGIAKFECEDCGAAKYQKVSGEHSYEETVEDATCTTPQRIVVKCLHCDDVKTEEVLSEALGHKWNETHIDATCTTPAGVAKKCANANCEAEEGFAAYPESSSAYEAAKGHSYGEAVVVEATCVKGGYTYQVCADCKDEKVTNETEIDSEAHKPLLVDTIKEPTCTEDGVGKYVCEDCNETLTYTAIPASHDWGEVVANEGEAPTCAEAGKGTKTCATCGEVEDVEMPATGDHDYVANPDEAVAGNCGVAGKVVEYCSVCNDKKETVIEATGEHTWVDKVFDATCTTPQEVGKVCSVCKTKGATSAVEGSVALGHKVEKTHVYETCTTPAGYTGVCETCGEPVEFTPYKEGEQGYKTATGHIYGEKTVVPATCKEGGYTLEVCTVETCKYENKTNLTEIDPEGHVAKLVSTLKEATCTVAGVGKYACEYCETSLGYKSIAAKHDWAEVVATEGKEATCATAGEGTKTCNTCGEVETVEIPATGEHDVEVTETKATCGEDGLKVEACKNCDYEKETVLSATGVHTMVEGVVDATCTAPQEVGEVCSVCGAKGETYPVVGSEALGHKYEKTLVAATCTEAAGYTQKCTREKCGSVIGFVAFPEGDKNYEAAKGHEWESVTVKATCNAEGYTQDECKNCDETQNKVVLEKDSNNHDAELVDTLKGATCTVAGVGKYVCSYCEASTYKTIPAAHTWDEGTVKTPASCYANGKGEKVCTVEGCGATEEYEIAATGEHDVEVTTTEATCGKDGLKVETCKTEGCEYKKETVLLATGEHNFVEGVVDATCTAPAKVGEVCSVCAKEGETFPVEGSQPLGHNYKETLVEATCTTPAGYTQECTREKCGSKIGFVAFPEGDENYEAARGHEWEKVEVKATCKAKGYTQEECANCDAVQNKVELEIDPNNHNEELTSTLKEADCTVAGVGKYTCKDCEKETYKTIPAGHTWGAVVTTKPATCVDKGTGTKTCTVCSATEEVEIAATGEHTYVVNEEKSKAATCGADGIKVENCSVCQAEKSETLKATGNHDYKEGVVDATCTAPQKVGIVCSVCKDEKSTQPVVGSEALGHDYKVTEVPATCTEAAGYTQKCTREDCGSEIGFVAYPEGDEKYAAAKGHEWESVTVKATCAADGYTQDECKNCDETQNKVVLEKDPNTHNDEQIGTLKAATCTVAGVGKFACEDCGTESYKTLDPAHVWGDVVVTTPATCAEAGEGVKACTVCEITEEVVVPATGEHTYLEDVTAATCGKDGLKVEICSGCEDKKETVIPATGEHTWAEGVVDATCLAPAKVGIVCSVCKAEKETVAVEGSEALGHDWAETLEEATCTTAAGITAKCRRCPATRELEEFPADSELYEAALGHKWETVTVKATCTKKGYTEEVCTTCGEKQNKVELPIDATNHNESLTSELKAATCTVAGVGKYTCADCKVETYKTIAPAHKWGEATEITAPTCGTAGKSEHTCTACSTKEEFEVAATGAHELEESVEAATCVKAGAEVKACANCDYEERKEIPATGEHNFVEGLIEATCTEAPQIGFKCETCDEVKGETVPVEDGKPLGHALKETHYDATCTTPSGTTAECTRDDCDYKQEFTAYPENSDVYVPALGHDYKEVVQEATCSEKGYTAKVCQNCNDMQDKAEIAIDENNHLFEEPVVLKEPTCTELGVGKYVCYFCDVVEYVAIPAEHTWDETTEKVNEDSTIVYYACCVEGCEGVKVVSCVGEEGHEGEIYATIGKAEEALAAKKEEFTE